jgi:hypothetical protein
MRTFARLTGLVVLLYGAWMFSVNLLEGVTGSNGYDPRWMLFLVLGFGLAGAIGGILFLLSLDGPPRFRTRSYRLIGWVGMLICAVLPTSLYYVLLIMVAISSLSLFRSFESSPEEASINSE